MFIEAIPESKSYKSDTFSYSVPKEYRDIVRIGCIANIPFGKKKIRGLITKIINDADFSHDQGFKVKDISSVDPWFEIPVNYLGIIDWIAEYYFCTRGEALSLFLPPKMKRPPKLPAHNATSTTAYDLKNLSSAQDGIYSEIIRAGACKPHLIYGVTGSGKTEIYIHLAAKTLLEGKNVIILIPEIILTPQTVERFRAVFGQDVAIINSHLSQGEKYNAYRQFNTGEKRIIIGPRSALLIPNANIGLIIIDEEHEDAYKQDNSPRYHAFDLAERIASSQQALFVAGSATPRIESYYKAEKGQYILHQLQNRYNKLILPPSQIVDLRNELRAKNNSVISNLLRETIAEILKKKKQTILFLNRRGSSTFVSCRDCGFVIKCPNCDIPLVHHATDNAHLYCHHCDWRIEAPALCPDCQGSKIKYFGAGVEKVETEVKSMFPEAKVRRIDTSTIKSKTDYENFYQDFKNHKFDIAIGTQMITKGLDLPHVDLVGIISADTGLHMPYFRASEKVFRLITQVSGRSGRAGNVGRTIIQSYWPDSGPIRFAANHDTEGFFNSEIASRKLGNYPPFSRLIRVVSEDQKSEKAKAELEKIIPALDELSEKYPELVEYIGPGLCFFQRIRGRWRYHLIIKLKKQGADSEPIQILLDKLKTLWRDNLNLVWDSDPADLL